jgi:peptidoglycan/xylan/chitin deacetylase (PgdA/CDA1 family)
MKTWNSKFIDAYRLATTPLRKLQFRRMQREGTVPILSLFYHRVADHALNEWTMTCADFQRQIDWLQENFDLVDLEESQRRIRSGFNDRPTVSITFDDGYAENCDFALPLLIERGIPATYFVTTYHTTEQQTFPHDRELNTPLPTNTIESLRSLDLAGIEIGAHTRSHYDLGKITCEETLVDEVIHASNEMGELIGRKLRYFAFPFGKFSNLNPAVFHLLKEAGFLGVCSAYQGWNEIGGDAFHIQRIHADPVFARVKNWLTLDPRMAKTKRYDYEKHDSKIDSPKPIDESNSTPPLDVMPTLDNSTSQSSQTPTA